MKLFRLDRDVALVTGASVWQSCRRRGTFSPSLLPLNGMHTVVEVLKTAANGTFASSRMDVKRLAAQLMARAIAYAESERVRLGLTNYDIL